MDLDDGEAFPGETGGLPGKPFPAPGEDPIEAQQEQQVMGR